MGGRIFVFINFAGVGITSTVFSSINLRGILWNFLTQNKLELYSTGRFTSNDGLLDLKYPPLAWRKLSLVIVTLAVDTQQTNKRGKPT